MLSRAGVGILSRGRPAVRGLFLANGGGTPLPVLRRVLLTAHYSLLPPHCSLPVPQLPPNKRLTTLYLTININVVYCLCSFGHEPLRSSASHAPPPRRPSNSSRIFSPTRVTTL